VDLIDERLPIRYTAFSGNRSDDLEMLLERKYSLSQANHILDLIYANRYGIPLNRRNIVPHQISLVSVVSLLLKVKSLEFTLNFFTDIFR
jgi:hypothetical protein